MTLKNDLLGPTISREKLFSLYEAVVKEQCPHVTTECIPPDTLQIRLPEGRTVSAYMENLWREFQLAAPEDRLEVFNRYLQPLISTIETQEKSPPTKERVIPTIKDLEYVSHFGAANSIVQEHLAGDIWIVYAVDSPDSITTLSPAELAKLEIGEGDLLRTAVANLKNVLPDIERHGSGPVYMLTAGGDYVASILLLDDVWTQLEEVVEGDVVASVPSRDLILFTGSSSKEGIEQIRQKAREIHEGGDHVISQTLLRRTRKKWRVFE